MRAHRRSACRQALAAAALLALQPAQSEPVAAAPAAALADLGQALLRQASPGNAVVSPLVVTVALGMVHAGAAGAAEHEIEALFGARPAGARALRQGLPALVKQLRGDAATPSPLTTAARLWIDTEAAAAVPAAYARRLAGRWRADAARVEFAHSEAARSQINAWTAEHSAGQIKELLPAGSVSAATRTTLTAAVHFRSAWDKPFDPVQTMPRPFRTAAGESLPVSTMVDERSVLQASVDGHRVFELPFARGGFALLLAVPDEAGAAPAGFGGEQLARWRAALKPALCKLALPRFAITPQAASIKPALQALGVKTVFSEDADLRPMLGRQARQMRVDDVHHAAGITIDEQGGEAVAAAAVTVRSKSLSLPAPSCAVDRAFAFALIHQASGAALFVGRIGDPGRPP